MLTVQSFGDTAGADALAAAAGLVAGLYRRGDKPVAVVSSCRDANVLAARAEEICSLPRGRELDALLSAGASSAAALMAMALADMDVPAVSLTGTQAGIITDGVHGDGDISAILVNRLTEELEAGKIPVIAGGQGVNGYGDIVTLGYCGAEITAAAVAAALGIECCEIYGSIDGIYTADPKLVRDAVKLTAIDYDDMLALTRAGSVVICPKALEVARRHGVTLRLRSRDKAVSGTLIKHLELKDRPLVSGVTRNSAKSTVTAVGYGVCPGTAAAIVSALREAGIEPSQPVMTDISATVKVPPEQLDGAIRAIHTALF